MSCGILQDFVQFGFFRAQKSLVTKSDRSPTHRSSDEIRKAKTAEISSRDKEEEKSGVVVRGEAMVVKTGYSCILVTAGVVVPDPAAAAAKGGRLSAA